ncbi:CHAT domain-containing protein [Pseudanabaena minima]|uniref:CHAT domain-containing protein n=1 Tax=Pseudanabaena minima TaxID=890415 RepID=UPI003DA84250
MISRIYSLKFVLVSGLCGILFASDLSFAIAQAQTSQNRKVEAERLLEVCRNDLKTGKNQQALQDCQQALDAYKAIRDLSGASKSLLNLGVAHYALGKYDQAIEYYLQSLAIAREIKDRLAEGKSLGNMGVVYLAFGKYDKAIELHLQSLAINREIKDRLSEGQDLGNLGLAYYSLGKYDQAINSHLQLLAIAREFKDRLSEGQSLGNLGLVYYALGKYDQAIEYHRQRLTIAKEIKDRLSEGQSLGNLGIAYQALGRYDKAIEHHLQFLAIARDLKDRLGEGAALGNLGVSYKSLGKYDKAIEYYLQSLAIARAIKDRQGEGKALGNLGNAYDFLGKYDKAIEYHLQYLAIAREIKDRDDEGLALGNLSAAYNSLGKYEKAIDYSLQYLAIAREIKDRRGEGQALGNLGVAYDSLGKYDKAIESHLQLLAIAREIKDRNAEGISLNNLGFSFENLGQLEIASLYYKESINVYESIRKDIRKLDQEEQRSYLGTISKRYKGLATLLLNQGRIMEALQVLDLLKVQELEDYLKNIKGNDRSAQGVRILEPERAIRSQLLALSLEKGKDLNRQLATQIQQLPKSEINKVPDYLQQIPQGTVLLYPLILGDQLELIFFSPNTIPIRRTVKISKDKLEFLITEYRAGLIDSESEDVKEASKALYDVLIKPFDSELAAAKANTILYAPDGVLRYVPLAALYDGKQWLVEKYRISNLIAYTLTDFSPKPKSQPIILAGAFGGKAGEKKFGQFGLPASLKEVQSIARSFQNSVTLTENNFSRQAIESKFKNHNIIHLATHAEFNVGAPENSFIIFGNGDKIHLNEITDWQIPNIDLIVLSACQTGTGKLGDGVEILGFGYQVQKAGAKMAIASLWSVSDAGTGSLMMAFYDQLQKKNVSISESLRQSQITLIQSKEYRHPYFWSAFFVIGNGL